MLIPQNLDNHEIARSVYRSSLLRIECWPGAGIAILPEILYYPIENLSNLYQSLPISTIPMLSLDWKVL